MTTAFRKIAPLLLLLLGLQLWLVVARGMWGMNMHIAVLAIILVVSLIPPASDRIARALNTLRHPSARTIWITSWVIAISSSIYLYLTALRQGRQFALHIHDEFSYMTQIQMLLRGRLWMPAHPVGEFFENFYLLHTPQYASIYFPGTALMLWPGVAVGLPHWLAPLIVGGAIVGIVYRITAEVLDGVYAFLAALLMLGVPLFRWMSLRVMSTGPSILLGLLIIWAWLRWRRAITLRAKTGWTITIGAFTGWLAITRPFDCLCVVLPILLASSREIRAMQWRQISRSFACCLLAGSPFLGLQVVMNQGITGSVFTTPYAFYHARDVPQAGLGFAKVDQSRAPVSALPQKQAFYRDLVMLHLKRHEPATAFADWWQNRIPTTLANIVPHPLLYVLVPCTLLGLNDRRRWAMFGVLPASILVYELFTFFLPTYALVAAPAMAFGLAMSVQTLCASLTTRWIRNGMTTFFTLGTAALPILSSAEFNRLQFDDFLFMTQSVNTIDDKLNTLPIKPAIVLFTYSPNRSIDLEPVYNPHVAWPDDARVIRAHDLGAERNAALYRYFATHGPDRAAYLYDEASDAIHFLGNVRDLAAVTSPATAPVEAH